MYLLHLLYVLLFAKKVGNDEFGNKYYTKKDILAKRKRRFVIYKGKVEASKVPDIWDAWLRGTINYVPSNAKPLPWQNHHTPNLSGTKHQYNPKLYNSSINSYNNYTPWKPSK